MKVWGGIAIVIGILLAAVQVSAQVEVAGKGRCCKPTDGRVLWTGDQTRMSLEQLAAYAAPVLWYSPDEPLLEEIEGPEPINIPMAFPFEEPSEKPVVYYRVREIIRAEDEKAYFPAGEDRSKAQIELSKVTSVQIDYFHYYPYEAGLGGHTHDVESVEVNLVVVRHPDCQKCRYSLAAVLVNAKAHGIKWFDNTLETDNFSRFPMHAFVEEGKHASCPDQNADGLYTPGFDVNRRVNDAWGIRDTLRGGMLFTGAYQSWFFKPRKAGDRVFPPLPDDSAVRDELDEYLEEESDPTFYVLRPYPRLAAAKKHDDDSIVWFVDKGYDDWPEVEDAPELPELTEQLEAETFTRSLSIAGRYDGDWGVSGVFPFFIVAHLTDPVGGGWIMHRVYLKDEKLRDFGWGVLYTPSASRWVDGYTIVGLEVDAELDAAGEKTKETDVLVEGGLKFRVNTDQLPLGFINNLTDFWGIRLGVTARGFSGIDDLGWVIELGAGSF
ncbi:hypothetical protein FIV42_24735 [Persicimonas caeni]|uniref:Uncharacterized protein n=1 Tax=Persicimonas caeni TaxID=2292766 RepID=A0A4Y6PZV1_PERCE|nr:hypothetical protein [Persicimonas caeni]QDG53834.1 hypothetical protein FIV42_24735 [Persicimonas caeni]QED35055.1 hypothetical protein FRD00_24730 [Persicimonas caeni]